MIMYYIYFQVCEIRKNRNTGEVLYVQSFKKVRDRYHI